MRVLLQQPPQGSEAPRYVSISLQQDLLGGWTLMRESGQIGGKSQLKREQFLDTEPALAAFEKARYSNEACGEDDRSRAVRALRALEAAGGRA